MPQLPKVNPVGAPKGNQNALKHGYYRDLMTINELKKLGNGIDVLDEQEFLRTITWRVGQHLEFKSLDLTQLGAFDKVIDAVTTIGTLERIKIFKRGRGGELGKTILEALTELDPFEELE